MQNLLLVGSKQKTELYLASYIDETKFKSFNIEYYNDKISVDIVRELKKSLSRKSSTPRLFILSGEMSPESQNALLKCLEESAESIYFLITTEKLEVLLPTVISRCRKIHLGFDVGPNETVCNILKKNTASSWQTADELSSYFDGNTLDDLLPSLRFLLLEEKNKELLEKYFRYCKSAISYLPLQNNNISKRIILEKILNGL